VRWPDNLTTFMYRLSRNSGSLNFLEPKGLSRPVIGLLYLYLYSCRLVCQSNVTHPAGLTRVRRIPAAQVTSFARQLTDAVQVVSISPSHKSGP